MRGGHLLELYKGKGPRNQTPSYREVVISDSLSKATGSLTRVRAAGAMCKEALETQLGSELNGGAVDVTHLHYMAMADAAAAYGQSFACLFCDLSSAFASVIRR